jgi:hypothetical protein
MIQLRLKSLHHFDLGAWEWPHFVVRRRLADVITVSRTLMERDGWRRIDMYSLDLHDG